MAWTDEKKAEVIKAYEESDPTPETSVEIVKQIAEEVSESPNGVRMILTKAGVYIKKNPSTSGGSSDAEKKPARQTKAGAQEALTAAITDTGQEASDEIISKLTGKAAQYFTTLVEALNK